MDGLHIIISIYLKSREREEFINTKVIAICWAALFCKLPVLCIAITLVISLSLNGPLDEIYLSFTATQSITMVSSEIILN